MLRFASTPLQIECTPINTIHEHNYSIWREPFERKGFPNGSVVKTLPVMQEMQEKHVQSLGQEDPLEEEMATHPSILAWEIP